MDVDGARALWLESAPEAGDFSPRALRVGQCLRFNGSLCRHHTVPNTSTLTRCSFDLRVVPASAVSADGPPLTRIGDYGCVFMRAADGGGGGGGGEGGGGATSTTLVDGQGADAGMDAGREGADGANLVGGEVQTQPLAEPLGTPTRTPSEAATSEDASPELLDAAPLAAGA